MDTASQINLPCSIIGCAKPHEEVLHKVWQALCSAIDEKYDMEQLWNTGGKKWTYEYKYRRGGKTLCSLYAKGGCVGSMIIFGER